MSEPGGTTKKDGVGGLSDRLLNRGWEFDFFQAVWLLERLAGGQVSVGDRGPVGRERFRFRPDAALGFPASDVREIRECRDPVTEDAHYLIEITFLGLYGVSTPLPPHYAVDILRAVEQAGAPTDEDAGPELSPEGRGARPEPGRAPARDFLDIFHHRLISLFYRSWLKYRYDRAYGLPHRDTITDYLRWLIGFPPEVEEDAVGLSPIRMLRYAGVLTQHPRSGPTLEGMLFDYWKNLPTKVEQCMGRWVPIAPDDLNRMGSANSRLGADLTVGEQVYDLSGAFSISVGPVNWGTYLLFLPDGPRFAQTRALVELYCADPLAATLEIRLGAGEVPELRLSSDDEAGQLGYTSWVRTDDVPETAVTFGLVPTGRDAPASPATESARTMIR